MSEKRETPPKPAKSSDQTVQESRTLMATAWAWLAMPFGGFGRSGDQAAPPDDYASHHQGHDTGWTGHGGFDGGGGDGGGF